MPPSPDYPPCLSHLLRREVWQSTLGQVEADLAARKYSQLFVKPAVGAKGFSGTVLTGPVDDTLSGEFGFLNAEIFPLIGESGGREAPVFCSQVVDMNSEYAVYVVDGKIRQICHYMCKTSTCRCKNGEKAAAGESTLDLDMHTVNEAIGLMDSCDEFRDLRGV